MISLVDTKCSTTLLMTRQQIVEMEQINKLYGKVRRKKAGKKTKGKTNVFEEQQIIKVSINRHRSH